MDPTVIAALLNLGSTGLSVGSNFLTNSLFGNKDLEASKDMAYYNYKLQRQFTRDYHSLNTESLRDAGLNPLLSATGGSSGTFSPGGGFGRSSVSGVKVPDGSDFLNLLKGTKELDILDETKKKLKAETDSIKESTRSTKLSNDHRTKYPSSSDSIRESFMNLPSNVRKAFNNDPAELYNAFMSGDRDDELISYGLKEKAKPKAPTVDINGVSLVADDAKNVSSAEGVGTITP